MAAASAGPSPPTTGAEVPILGSDRLKWVDLTVPSPPGRPGPPSPAPSQPPLLAPRRGASSCHLIPGDPPSYVIWRIHDDSPDALELVEFCTSKEFPESGIRLVFPEPLHPFSFIYKNQAENVEGNQKMVYAVTVSGIAYLFALRNACAYLSGSSFPMNDLAVHDVQSHSSITSVAAISGCLVVGRQDGSVGCYRLASLHQAVPGASQACGFVSEFRDDMGMGRLWSLMARGRAAGPVQHIIVSECFGRKLLFAAHLDGSLRVWDLISNTRLLNHISRVLESPGSAIKHLWIGDANYEARQIVVAALFRSSSDTIVVYGLDFTSREKLTLSSEIPVKHVPLHERRIIDLKIAMDGVWILEEDGTTMCNLYYLDINMGHTYRYELQENFISDQLFQNSGHSFLDSTWANLSMFSSAKDQAPYVISSVFLRRLLQPDVHLGSALYATLLDQKNYMSQYEVQSLAISELKKEILSIIESQGHAANTRSTLLFWKNFCSQYTRHWCQNNPPYALFRDNSSGVMCLIRRSSMSLFRHLEHIETFGHDASDGSSFPRTTSLSLLSSGKSNEILCEVLKCLNIINHQLDTSAAAAVTYECLLDPSVITYEGIVFNFVKDMNTGCCSAEIGEVTWDKISANHGTHRKFAMLMLASLHTLLLKATTWDQVLDVFLEYLKNFVPDKCFEAQEIMGMFSVNSCLLIHAATQISKTMFNCTFNMLVFLGFLVSIGPQIRLAQSELTTIKLKIVPMVLDIITHWHILHFLGSTATELPSLEDFSTKLSSLHIDSNGERQSFQGKLGKSAFTLAFLLDFPISSEEVHFTSSNCLPSPNEFIKPVKNFCNRVIWNDAEEKSNSFLHSIIELSCILLRHGQYEAAEKLLLMVDAHLSRTVLLGVQDAGSKLSICLHLLGFCILVRAQAIGDGVPKDWRIHKSVGCFFRAASGERALVGLRNLSFQTGLICPCSSASATVWKFFYYQWAMQLFEQYNLSDAACQFALAALEQIDEVFADDDCNQNLAEPPSTIRGRLWANIFKFSLDLNRYSDAYCAIISNPDDDSKSLCLRRFIIVLCERDEMKVFCDGGLPFVGLIEKVEKELLWKAERSDASSRPNLYKLLYGFEIYRKNWRKAASYMYRYSVRLRHEINSYQNHRHSKTYEEVLCALSASINALQLVNPSQAWIDSQQDSFFYLDKSSSNKRARKVVDNSCFSISSDSQKLNCFMDIEMLEKEYVLTLVQHLLSLVNVNFTIYGEQGHISSAVDALIQENFYDMSFTVIMKCCEGSKLKSELERVFMEISQKCCGNYLEGSLMGIDMSRSLLLTSSDNEVHGNGKMDNMLFVHQCPETPNWEMLERHLEKYKKLHPRLPVTVAETLLFSDPQIELPLWLVHMFKGGRRATPWGMTGREADSATLFRLYVDYGRYAEAANLFLEYIEAFASLRPVDVTNRKRMSAVWFPYVSLERLVSHLEEVQSSGRMVDHCDRLKYLIHGALQNHIKQINVDSEDAMVAFRE